MHAIIGCLRGLGEIDSSRAAAQLLLTPTCFVHSHLPGVYLQDAFASIFVGVRQFYLSVKTPRTEQRGVQHIRSVGCCDDLRNARNFIIKKIITIIEHWKPSISAFVRCELNPSNS